MRLFRPIRSDTLFILVPAVIFLSMGAYLFFETFVRNIRLFPLGVSTLLPPVLVVLGLIGAGVAYFTEKWARLGWASEERFRGLIEEMPVGVSISTPEGGVMEANPALLEMLGYGSKGEFLRLHASALYSDKADWERFIEAVEAAGSATDFEVRLRRRDGAELWGLVSAVKRRGAGGRQHINVVQDITERRQAEDARRESEAKYRKVINTTSQGFWKFNANAQVVEVNEAFLGMVGLDVDEVKGRSVYDLVAPESLEAMRDEVSRIHTSDHRQYRLLLKRRGGSGLGVLCNGTTLWDKDGNPAGAFAFITAAEPGKPPSPC